MAHYEVVTTPYLPVIKQYTTLIPVLCDIVDEYLNLYKMEHELKLAVERETATEPAAVVKILNDLLVQSKRQTTLESTARADAARACLLLPFIVLSTGRALNGLSFHVWNIFDLHNSIGAIAKTFADEAKRREYSVGTPIITEMMGTPIITETGRHLSYTHVMSITLVLTDTKLDRTFEITCDTDWSFADETKQQFRLEHKDEWVLLTRPTGVYYETYLLEAARKRRRLLEADDTTCE